MHGSVIEQQFTVNNRSDILSILATYFFYNHPVTFHDYIFYVNIYVSTMNVLGQRKGLFSRQTRQYGNDSSHTLDKYYTIIKCSITSVI